MPQFCLVRHARALPHCRLRLGPSPLAPGSTLVLDVSDPLLNLLAYELLHARPCVMQQATGVGSSLRRLRERVLRVASRVVRHGRRLTFVIAQDAAADWLRLWGELGALDWAPG